MLKKLARACLVVVHSSTSGLIGRRAETCAFTPANRVPAGSANAFTIPLCTHPLTPSNSRGRSSRGVWGPRASAAYQHKYEAVMGEYSKGRRLQRSGTGREQR